MINAWIGLLDIRRPGPDGTVHSVTRKVEHPRYNPDTYDYDYALLQLRGEVDFARNRHVGPACLPRADERPGEEVNFKEPHGMGDQRRKLSLAGPNLRMGKARFRRRIP